MNNLPTIEQLASMDVELSDKQSTLQALLNKQPPKSFISTDSMSGTPYIPIEKVEYLLTNIFKVWHTEVKSYKLIANSVCVEVRLHYKDPLTGEMYFEDGVGASPLQTKKGAGATDFVNIQSASVQMALPAAKSYATKDAAGNIGKIFGKDLGRKTTSNYDGMVSERVVFNFENPQLTEK